LDDGSGRLRVRGGTRLCGTVAVHAAKNAALPLLAAALLTRDGVRLRSVPELADVATMRALLEELGAEVRATAGGDLEVRCADVADEAPYALVRRMRASLLVMGPLLARLGRVRAPLPGGCAIGDRPIDFHLKGFAALGAEVTLRGGYVEARAPAGLHGARIYLDYPSHTGTENLMLAAVLARGQTLIENAAEEPEVVDLANCLNAMGARVSGAGTPVIRVDGVDAVGGADWTPIPDRIEAGTLLIAGAITRGEIELTGVIPQHVQAVVAKLRETGAEIWQEQGRVFLVARRRPAAVDVKTLPYPGFPTDLQPQMTALLATADGVAAVTETVFDNRLGHADELRRMGAQIRVEGRTALVTGVARLSGAPVQAADLRAGAALVLAGLAAAGETEVGGLGHIERGYADLPGQLRALGADVERLGGADALTAAPGRTPRVRGADG
jgi:UDP-N-acetylglucosamine 1-carboxyvinyltransferase